MYKYSAAKDELSLKGKKLSPKRKKEYFRHACLFALQIMEEDGDFLSFPPDSEHLPRLSQVLIAFETDEELRKLKDEAETIRLAMLKEELMRAIKAYQQLSSKENKESVELHEKVYSKLLASKQLTQNIQLVYNGKFPDDYWEDGPDPENPRIGGIAVSLEEYKKHNENRN